MLKPPTLFSPSKYTRRVIDEIEILQHQGTAPTFDFSVFEKGPIKQAFGRAVQSGLRGLSALSRITGVHDFHLPFIPFKFITRKADLEAAFETDTVFRVPFGPEMEAIAGPVTFGLGLDDDEHKRQRAVMQAFVAAHPLAAGSEHLKTVSVMARAMLDDSGGQIDVISEYMVPLISHTCLHYFGLTCPDPVAFARWNIAISTQLFATPKGASEQQIRQVAVAARKVRNCIETSMKHDPGRNTLLGYLFHLRDTDDTTVIGASAAEYLTDDRIIAIVAGMVSGFVPTTILSAGNLLTALIRHKPGFDALSRAARAGDRDLVRDIILEAARHRPAAAPGHFRTVASDFRFSRPGVTTHRWHKDDLILMATPAAMRDPAARRQPNRFRPGCPAEPDFMFGHDHHACVGKEVAGEVMTELYLCLFARDGLVRPHRFRPVGRVGPFPWSYRLRFDSTVAIPQSMITIGIPLTQNRKKLVEARLDTAPFAGVRGQLYSGCPAAPGRSAFVQDIEATGIIHNISICIAELTRKGEPSPTLLIEINADGTPAEIFDTVERHLHQHLTDLLNDAGKPAGQNVSTFLHRHHADLKQRLWGDVGLNFLGVGDFPNPQIKVEQELCAAIEPIVQLLVDPNNNTDKNPSHVLRVVRGLLKGNRQDRKYVAAVTTRSKGFRLKLSRVRELKTLERFEPLLYRPPGRIPKVSDHKKHSAVKFAANYLTRPKVMIAWTSVVWAPALLASVLTWYALADAGPDAANITFAGAVGMFLGHFTTAFISLTTALALVTIGFAVAFRRSEKRDVPDTSITPTRSVHLIEAQEDYPGFVQNQMTAVNTLKPGLIRRIVLALSLAVILRQVRYWFRSGFVADIGTIRNAKWFRLAGTDQLVFQANFDGSWEAYLEDFSNKAYPGQNSVWSHCAGFPKTDYLVTGGARDADKFKRWVRSKQIPTPFWYSRFPTLSNAQIRCNALIRDGLARAVSASDAQAWVSYFGSQPRTGNALETTEIQSILFTGDKALPYSACIGLRFKNGKAPGDALADRKAFIRKLLPTSDIEYHNLTATRTRDPAAPKIDFGDKKSHTSSVYIALSRHGLAGLGLTADSHSYELESFPAAFVGGMANRARILGDFKRNAPQRWDWADTCPSGADAGEKSPSPTDILLFAMAPDEPELTTLITRLEKMWSGCASEVMRVMTGVQTSPTDRRFRNPLGFRDGISQPVMKGTHRGSLPASDHDIVEPGEIILGYADNRDVFPPTPQIEPEKDPQNRLSELPEKKPAPFVAFGTRADAPRDLGRNGSFMVVRQVELDENSFDRDLNNRAASSGVSADFLAAKIVGRWKSGASLVRHPYHDPGVAKPKENDFLFKPEDPQGFRCPLGSHIRRANPRDTFGTDTETQLEISNRHRILRRGRVYSEAFVDGETDTPVTADLEAAGTQTANAKSEGLLFVALNANIERQFEFVQQTWVNSMAFHGLRDDSDPLLSYDTVKMFNIQTPNGSITMKDLQSHTRTRGGGYFFVPGRTCLQFLADDV